MKTTGNSRLLLGVWLILIGLKDLLHIDFLGLGVIMAILAIGTGVLILNGK